LLIYQYILSTNQNCW